MNILWLVRDHLLSPIMATAKQKACFSRLADAHGDSFGRLLRHRSFLHTHCLIFDRSMLYDSLVHRSVVSTIKAHPKSRLACGTLTNIQVAPLLGISGSTIAM